MALLHGLNHFQYNKNKAIPSHLCVPCLFARLLSVVAHDLGEILVWFAFAYYVLQSFPLAFDVYSRSLKQIHVDYKRAKEACETTIFISPASYNYLYIFARFSSSTASTTFSTFYIFAFARASSSAIFFPFQSTRTLALTIRILSQLRKI